MSDPSEHLHQVEQTAPLSYAQQRLWLLDRLMPTGAAYNTAHLLQLSGELDPAALRAALNALVGRHEVLRTRFAMVDGQPVQVIAPELPMALGIEELRDCAPEARVTEATRRAQAEVEAPFDLERGPLIRARLFRLAPSEHWLLLVLHHIVTDGWSSGVLRHELTTLYSAFRRDEPSPLPALPIQYADFAQWQREWLQGAVLEQQLRYWRQKLAALPTLELPSDRPRPAQASYRGGSVLFEVPEALTASLKGLSRREGATLFMTLLAAYQILLFRYSGQDDVAVGVPTAGRTRPQLEGLIGFFVNTLVLRGDLSGSPGFTQYLRQVRDVALDAYSHQDLPFEKLVEELAPRRDLSRNPLFQASLAFQNTPAGHWELPGLDVRRLDGVDTGGAKFDLTLSLTEHGGKLAGDLEYASDLFDVATIERMASHFVRLLEGIVADPACRVDQLPLLTATERQRLLVAWNDTAAGYPEDRCIHELFEQQATRNPDAVAVVFDERQMTYGELDARANRLAHHLSTLGVGPDVLVGLCAERSLDLVVGLMAILKAGGAYVPLDPRYPEERLRFILQDTGLPVLLTQRSLTGKFPAARCAVVFLDAPLPQAGPGGPARLASPDRLAYVIYTSGSTGVPKGVAIEHRNTVSFLHWVRAAFTDEELAGVLCSTSICFDLSVFELFGALCWGGKAILVETALDLAACPRRQEVTLVNSVPSVIQTLLEAQRLPESVTTVNLCGEPLRAALVDALYASPHVRRVHDLYGPTETTTYSTWTLRAPRQRETIGVPIANTQVYLLDACLNPVPIGVTGELCIGGHGVARGYLNRPELTAERFVPDPFRAGPGARLYRTGDLARHRPDGNIELLGRADSQVKLRGFRIELGEIEMVLTRHPQVRAAAVIVREDLPGEKRLAAYVVARDATVAVADLRAWLERQLPDYMVPTAFVALPALPLTPNGKVDRKALPAPEHEATREAFEPPGTPMETAIASIWADVLHRPRVGRNDSFFDLGGHSLLAAQAIAMTNQALGIDLTLRQLFETPTVRELALSAANGMHANADAAMVAQHDGPFS